MKKFYLSVLFTSILLTSCGKKEVVEDPKNEEDTTATALKNPINKFTWKAMNSWYNWQSNVSALADTKDDNKDAFHKYLNTYDTPEKLFESLLHQKGTVDRFSWFIEDYVEQQKQFQGISTSFGMKIKLFRIDGGDNVGLLVQYVSKGSPADKAGFKRGDVVNAINGIVMTTSNYLSAIDEYYNKDTAEFTFIKNDGSIKEKKTITKAEVADNPVLLTKVFDNVGGKKVGYLVYNGFRSSYNDELNAAFGELKAAGIQELILDFRINGGGSVQTCTYLASMINEAAGQDNFAELRFNQKHTNQNDKYTFQNNMNVYDLKGNKTGTQQINRLSGLQRVYVLTSKGTASASEMIINGLRPFMTVKTIGTTTYGKNVGSITLYDAPASDYTNVKAANSSHKKAMQPIVFQIYNKSGESDYTQGFKPDIEVDEIKGWRNILGFGNENETLLKAALNDIKGISGKPSKYLDNKSEVIAKGFSEHRFDKEMYLESDFFNRK